MKLPAEKHTKQASVGVDNVTATGILHKIQQWVRKACYNADTDSYAPLLTSHTMFLSTPHKKYATKAVKRFRYYSSENRPLTGFCTIKTLGLHILSHQASGET
jgi:hypothetical protein